MTKPIMLLIAITLAAGWAAAQSKRIPSGKPDSRTCKATIIESSTYSTSSISGLVVDSANVFVPDVLLELRSTSGRKVSWLKNDAKGNFRFPPIPEGDYILKARWLKKGFDCVEFPVRVTGSLEEPKMIVLSVSPVEAITELK